MASQYLFTAIQGSSQGCVYSRSQFKYLNNEQQRGSCLQLDLEPTEQADTIHPCPDTLTCGCSCKQWCWYILLTELQRLWRCQVVTIQSHQRLVSHRCHQTLAGLPSASFPQGIFPIGAGRDIPMNIQCQFNLFWYPWATNSSLTILQS